MLARYLIALSMTIATLTVPVIADRAIDREPVLRLRLSDPILDALPKPFLRPRLSDNVTTPSESVPMPKMTFEDAGKVGKFAFIPTAHRNVVVAVGATDDRTEVGRQIDRAIMEMTPNDRLYQSRQDSAPFIGFGFRAGQSDRGWAFNATIGASMVTQSEAARLMISDEIETADGYDAEARANLRLRYRF